MPAGNDFKIAQNADNVSIMVKDGKDLKLVMQHVNLYERAAGAKVNISKSVIALGPRTAGRMIRVLGVQLGINREECAKMWECLLNPTQGLVNFCHMKGMGLKGKVTMINIVIIPKLV